MKVTSVEFIKSVVNLNDLPGDNLKQIAFAGRSNVGKSSLINSLLNRKKIAKVSSAPGKTRQLNFFKVNNEFYFVDLPGYGFARASKTETSQWQSLIEEFLSQSVQLAGVVSLIDSRLGPTKLDHQLFDWLGGLDIPLVLVATKSDKQSKSALQAKLAQYSRQITPSLTQTIIPFSVINGTGKKEVWRELSMLMEK